MTRPQSNDDSRRGIFDPPSRIDQAYERSLNFLSYRPRSVGEVARYLRQKGYGEAEVEAVTERLQGAGLLDEQAFADFWVSNRSEFSPRGRRALWQELRQKGVERTVVESALEATDEAELALAAGRRKLRTFQSLAEDEFRRRMHGYLMRRGFGAGQARDAVSVLWAERQGNL